MCTYLIYLISTYTNYMGTVCQVLKVTKHIAIVLVIDLGEKIGIQYYFNWVTASKVLDCLIFDPWPHSHVLLLMEEIRRENHLGCEKPVVNDGINYQPQLVIAGFLNHQRYVTSYNICTPNIHSSFTSFQHAPGFDNGMEITKASIGHKETFYKYLKNVMKTLNQPYLFVG